MKARFVTQAVAVAILVACESNPLVKAGTSQLVASVEGSVVAAYEGTGEFSTAPAGLPRPFKFSLRSTGRGTASNQGFEFHSRDVPGVGVYALGHTSAADGQAVHAAYSWRDGSRVEKFAAQTGELVITEASADRIVGTFRFTGRLTAVCTATHSSAQSCTVLAADPDAKQVTAAGSFEAVPARRNR